MEDHQTLLSSIDGSNNGKTSLCAQGTNQVSYYRYGARKLVELYESNRSINISYLMNHRHSW